MIHSPELTQVEQPFIDQLVFMGSGSIDHPDVTGGRLDQVVSALLVDVGAASSFRNEL